MMTLVLQKVRDRVVPRLADTPFTKRWWSKELANERKQVIRLGRAAYRKRTDLDHPAHAEYRKARNKYGENIGKAKKEHWEAFLEGVDEATVWNYSKYIRKGETDGGKTRVPPLQTTDEQGRPRLAQDNAEKSRILHTAFFPNLGQENAPDPVEYPIPKFTWPKMTTKIVEDVIASLHKFKAPGVDGIPNAALVWGSSLLAPA